MLLPCIFPLGRFEQMAQVGREKLIPPERLYQPGSGVCEGETLVHVL